ncbi:MAG: hypothetical protein ACR2Q4_07695, partial [Geminicoccaceae bacterium]
GQILGSFLPIIAIGKIGLPCRLRLKQRSFDESNRLVDIEHRGTKVELQPAFGPAWHPTILAEPLLSIPNHRTIIKNTVVVTMNWSFETAVGVGPALWDREARSGLSGLGDRPMLHPAWRESSVTFSEMPMRPVSKDRFAADKAGLGLFH